MLHTHSCDPSFCHIFVNVGQSAWIRYSWVITQVGQQRTEEREREDAC